MGVWVSLRAPQLIPRDPEVYNRVFTSISLTGLELMTVGEQTQNLTTELPLRVTTYREYKKYISKLIMLKHITALTYHSILYVPSPITTLNHENFELLLSPTQILKEDKNVKDSENNFQNMKSKRE